MVRKIGMLALAALAGFVGRGFIDSALARSKPVKAKPAVVKLLKSDLAGSAGKRLFVTRLALPAGKKIPKHYHFGEEIIYLLSGSATVHIRGRSPVELHAGQAFYIPYKKVHWGVGGRERAEAVIFRVHDKGKPIRTLVR